MNKTPGRYHLKRTRFLLEELADILRTFSFHDPLLTDQTFTVTEVSLSADLKNATVYIIPFGLQTEEEAQRRIGRLNDMRPALRHRLSKSRLRVLPQLLFVYDRQPEASGRIDQLLDDIGAGD